MEVPEGSDCREVSAIIPERCPMISVLHTWGPILTVAGGALSVLLAVPAFRFGGVWRTGLRIAAFVVILGLSMLLEEQILNSAGVSENGSSDNHRQSERSTAILCVIFEQEDSLDRAMLSTRTAVGARQKHGFA